MISNLASRKYFVLDDFLASDELFALNNEFQELFIRGAFRAAKIGARGQSETRRHIRSDKIHWIDPEIPSTARDILWPKLNALSRKLNQELFLGLWSFEGHYALYPPGSFYDKHLDRFQNDSARTISMVLYLNQNWQPDDGGFLRLYLESGKIKDVEPLGGRLVCFLSGEVEHEVLPTRKERRSFTGWFKTR